MASQKVYFLSDLHLGAPYLPESKEAEHRIVRFLDYIKEDASEIYLLGDILDYWFEYRYVVPRGFVRFFGKLAELSDSGIKITWIIGNHDIWISDYIPTELGIEVKDGIVDRMIMGKRFWLAHGDGLGKTPLSFRIIRSVFRNKFAQWLFAGIHPRWTVPFAYSWSASSRKRGEAEMYSEKYSAKKHAEPFLKHLTEYSLDVLSSNPDISWFIYGHLHIVTREELSPTSTLIVLGEWIRTFSYAVYDGKELRLMKWSDFTNNS